MAERRPCEEVIGERRWVDGKPEFRSWAVFGFVLPSEFDLVEVGQRAALAYADEWATNQQENMQRSVWMLHPAEFGRARR